MLKRRHIRKFIRYDRLTGLIECKYPISMQEAGHLRVKIENDTYRMAEVIWALMHGYLPENAKIVQLDKNKLNFQLSNLALDNSKIINEAINKNRNIDFNASDTF